MVPLTVRSTSLSSSERSRMLSSMRTSGVDGMTGSLGLVTGERTSLSADHTCIRTAIDGLFEQRSMILYNTEMQSFRCKAGTFSRTVRFQTMSHFYLDV